MLPPTELLAQNPLFSSLSPQHREQIAARLTRHEIAANTAIVRQGDPADALFLIESGLVGVNGFLPSIALSRKRKLVPARSGPMPGCVTISMKRPPA